MQLDLAGQFELGETVTACWGESVSESSCNCKVLTKDPEFLELEIAFGQLLPQIDSSIRIELQAKQSTFWATVCESSITQSGTVLKVSDFRIENEENFRSQRIPCTISLQSAFLNEEFRHNPAKSIGRTINLSKSGARITTRTPLPKGLSIYLAFFVEKEKVIETLGTIVRVVKGAESPRGGYEIGVNFKKILNGEEFLDELVSEEAA